jgi:hypothetical protein
LSIDNNLSERSVRPVAIGRKNYLFMGSDNGGKAAAVLYSVMASAKANQIEPFAYVRNLLTQLSGCSPSTVAALLPDTWLMAHPESRRCWSQVDGPTTAEMRTIQSCWSDLFVTSGGQTDAR